MYYMDLGTRRTEMTKRTKKKDDLQEWMDKHLVIDMGESEIDPDDFRDTMEEAVRKELDKPKKKSKKRTSK
tara:strand:- start:478 stop:690 length:213 start_codon:yes stop_codon:yes gene_type:complete